VSLHAAGTVSFFAEEYFVQQLSTMHDDFKGTIYRKNQIWDLKLAK
jgi:hypothetical protein